MADTRVLAIARLWLKIGVDWMNGPEDRHRSAQRRLILACMGAALLGALLLSGPRMPIPTSAPVRVPSDVASYLARSEGAVGDIISGAEKSIL